MLGDGFSEYTAIFLEVFRNTKDLTLDPNRVPIGIRSFKNFGQMGMVVTITSQINNPLLTEPVQTTIASAFEALAVESSAQRKARVGAEAMGGRILSRIRLSIPTSFMPRSRYDLTVVLRCLTDCRPS